MALSRTEGLLISIGCVLLACITAAVVIMSTVGPQFVSQADPGVKQWKVKTRQMRPAARVPYATYGYKTPADAMANMASVQQGRIQAALGPKYHVRMYPAGVEEIKWMAANGVNAGPGLPGNSMTVQPAPAASACSPLPSNNASAASSGGALNISDGPSDWGAFIVESDADEAVLNAAIGDSNGANSGPSTPNETDPSIRLSAPAQRCAVSRAAALGACV